MPYSSCSLSRILFYLLFLLQFSLLQQRSPSQRQPVMFPGEVTSLCPPIHLLCTSCWDSAGKHCALLAAHNPPQILAHRRRELLALWSLWRSEMMDSTSLSRCDDCTSPDLCPCFPSRQQVFYFVGHMGELNCSQHHGL